MSSVLLVSQKEGNTVVVELKTKCKSMVSKCLIAHAIPVTLFQSQPQQVEVKDDQKYRVASVRID